MLGVDLERLELPGRLGNRLVPEDVAPSLHRNLAAEPSPDDDVLDRRRLLERLVHERLHRHLAAPAQRAVGGHDHLRLRVLQAAAAIAGAAKPEKIGTWIAPRCAQACEAIATSGDIGRKIATRSPGSTPSRRQRLGQARDLVRQLAGT